MNSNLSIAPNMLGLAYGKILRMPFLLQRTLPLVLAPVDDFLIFGPRNGLESMKDALLRITAASPDAILMFPGTARGHAQILSETRIIINLSASTTRSDHTSKWPIHSLEEALRCNASGVAFHINLTSRGEGRMLQGASRLIARAERYGLPTLGIIYPRRADSEGIDDNYDELRERQPASYAELISHCLSVGADLGFDLIKTKYTDDPITFRQALRAAGSIPVVVAGGPKVETARALKLARDATNAGAAGISFGRNLFGSNNPSELIRKIRTTVLDTGS